MHGVLETGRGQQRLPWRTYALPKDSMDITLMLGKFGADDRPLGFATRHFPETSVVVHGLRPEPHIFVVGTNRFVDRIGLNQLC
jgi:hypothetical protein